MKTTVWVVISDGDGGIDADVFTTEEAAERYREALYVSMYGVKDGTGLARGTLDFDHDFYASVRDCELVEDATEICEQIIANRDRMCTCTTTEDEGGVHLVPDPDCDGDPCESKAGVEAVKQAIERFKSASAPAWCEVLMPMFVEW